MTFGSTMTKSKGVIMRITVEVESLDKIGYSHQVRVPNPDIHSLCLARELSVVAVGTLKENVKVGNGSPARANPNVVQVNGLKSINVSDSAIEIIGEHNTVIIKERMAAKESPKSSESDKKTASSNEVSKKHYGKATARPTKRAKANKKDT